MATSPIEQALTDQVDVDPSPRITAVAPLVDYTRQPAGTGPNLADLTGDTRQ